MRLSLKDSSRIAVLAGFVAALAASALLFGATGIRTLLAMAVFFFLPFYLILRKFKFDEDERLFFAFFIGLGLFSTAVFYFGRVIPSFRVAVAVAFIALLLVPFALKRLSSRQPARQES